MQGLKAVLCLIPALLSGCGVGSSLSQWSSAGNPDEYAVPVRLDDGWSVASPEDVGLARAPLAEMTAAIRRGDYRNVHGVLIAKDGRLAYEAYFTGTDRRPETGDYSRTVTKTFDLETLHTLRSAAKSLTSALVGIAIDEGTISSVEAPLLDFFPEYEATADPEVAEIRLEDLLTMTPGFEWDQSSTPYSDANNPETAMSSSRDPVGFMLTRPVVFEPGSHWVYNSGTTTLLGLVLHRVTGESFPSYIQSRLFDPLGIVRFDWTGPEAWSDHPAFAWSGIEPWDMVRAADPKGSLWLRPRDMLKLGQLYADAGLWNGRQVVPADWVATSLEPRVRRNDGPREFANGTVQHGWYGYQWWHDRFELPWGEVTVHSASGNGGQRIWILPDLGLTVVHVAGNFNLDGMGMEADRLLMERIVPWALEIDSGYRHSAFLQPMPVEAGEWSLRPLNPADQARYVGTFTSGDQQVQIRELEDRIQVLPPLGEGPIDLIPTAEHEFVHGTVHRGEVTQLYFPDDRLVFRFDEGPGTGATHFEVVVGGETVESWTRIAG